jgi:ABC-type uncharacterized transport system ATPase subunit
MPNDEALVVIDKATKPFGEQLALDEIAFEIPAGQIFGLLGPNGAGETTLFRLLMGILKGDVGRSSCCRVGCPAAFCANV